MNNYDLRQIRLMQDKINSYKEQRINIGILIKDLRSLFNLLRESYSWKKDYYDAWFTLEQAYAFSLANNEPISKYQSYIDEGVYTIEIIIYPIIKENENVDAFE